MKLGFFFVIMLLLTTIAIADDIEVSTKRNDYGTSETVQFEVNINNVQLVGDLTLSNIKLKDSNNTNAAISVNLVKLNPTKYLGSFDLPSTHGNYILALEDVRYTKGDQLSKVTVERNLVVNDRKGLSVRPGFIYMELGTTDNPTLNFKLTNTDGNRIIVNLSTEGDFLQLEQNSLDFTDNANFDVKTSAVADSTGNVKIDYGGFNYVIPVYLKKSVTTPINQTIENQTQEETPKKKELKFFEELNGVKEIEVELEYGNSSNGIIYFKNTGDTELEDISVTLSDSLSSVVVFEYLTGTTLKPGDVGEINVTVNPDGTKYGEFSGELKVSSEEEVFDVMPFKLKLKQRLIDPEPTIINITLPPKIKEPEREINWGLWVFIALLLIVVGLVLMFYKKSKGPRRTFNNFISSLTGKRY